MIFGSSPPLQKKVKLNYLLFLSFLDIQTPRRKNNSPLFLTLFSILYFSIPLHYRVQSYCVLNYFANTGNKKLYICLYSCPLKNILSNGVNCDSVQSSFSLLQIDVDGKMMSYKMCSFCEPALVNCRMVALA